MSGGLLRRTALFSRKNCWISPKTISNYLNLSPVRCFSVTSRKNMKLLQFSCPDSPSEIRAGYLLDDGINFVDINRADPTLSITLLDILKKGELEKVKNLPSKSPLKTPLADVNIRAPITGMDKILCIGLNYIDHCEEQNLKKPEVPMIFSKFPSSVIGPSEVVRIRSDITHRVDWEVELVAVIGKTASFVKSSDAFNYIMGYTVGQDISARDWQREKNMGQFLLGKSMDTFCPIGPWITTSDEIRDPQNLKISCKVNNVQKQKSKTDKLIHKIPDVIERLSSVMTLLPGDIILTGTPGGVGMHRSPPEYLKPGDTVTSEIENIGVLEVKIEDFKKRCVS